MKKLLALIVAVVLVATLSLSAVVMVSATSTAIVVSEATAKAGDSVDITVTLASSPDITAAKVSIAYPSDLTIENVVLNNDLGGLLGTNKKPKDTDYPNPVLLNWSNGGVDFNGDLLLGTITFKVADDATEGDKTLTVTHNPADMADTNEAEVAFADVNGKITVVSCLHANTTEVAAVASTCKDAGHAAYTICNDCQAIISGSADPLPLADHTPGEATKENEVPATCKDTGSYTEVIKCTVCGETISSETKTIPTTDDHNFVWKTTAEAHWQECTVCGRMPANTESEAHKFEYKVTKEPTLTEEGLEEEVCSVCGYKSGETKTIDKLVDYTDTKETEYDAKGETGSEISTKIPKSKLTAGLNVKITVDGKAIELTEGTDYDVTEDANGNAKVTLKPAYLAKLANGTYKVEITGAGGISTSTVTVKNSAVGTNEAATATTGKDTAPKTGDSNIIFLIIALLAVMSTSVFVVYRKKRDSK